MEERSISVYGVIRRLQECGINYKTLRNNVLLNKGVLHISHFLSNERDRYLLSYQFCDKWNLDLNDIKLAVKGYSRTMGLKDNFNLIAEDVNAHSISSKRLITLYEMYQLSHRETSLALILLECSGQFFYKSALAWNSVYRSVLERPNSDLITKISHFKDEIKKTSKL